MAKQQKTQQYIFKINSTLLAKNNWDLNLSVERARRVPGLVVSLADSQILTWINELNGTENLDIEAKSIRHQIKLIKKENTCAENKRKIKELYKTLYGLQFKQDYVCIIMDKKSHYDRCNKGFKINGITYKRLLCTANGVKTSTVVYVSDRLYSELHKRVINGRDVNLPIVAAKAGTYESLTASASVPVSWPKGTIVVPDCIVKFEADLINIDDSDTTKEPIIQFAHNQLVENNCSDGCGMMLPSLAMRWNGELNGDLDNVLSGCNLRNSYTKGMVFCFDYLRFAEEVAGSYIVKDVWGTLRDLRESELILTEGQLKLWMCYSSWEDYYDNCIENNYTFRVAKTTEPFEELDNIRQTNYQFLQSLELPDDDIKELISYTVDEIKGILALDYRKALVYMCGKGLDEKTLKFADPVCQALMIDQNVLNDPYLRNRIRKMIDKRIKDAKIGVLDVRGNFQILSGDLYALCENMFGMEVHGLLKAGEIFSNYWIQHNTDKVFCARAPMSNAHSLISQKINKSEDVRSWFEYLSGGVIVVNAFDTMPMALNGFDYDGDLLFTTNNEVLLRNQHNLPALNCIQYKAKKCVATEEELVKSNKQGFGSHIGAITNRITQMTSLMANFSPDSEEYKILKYRTQCGQAQQQAEIDKAKGIVSNPMPKSWYVWSENKINEDDSEEVIAHKQLYRQLCAHKKPYFFQYNYDYLRADYVKYSKQTNENSLSLFNKSLKALLSSDTLPEAEQQFVTTYKNKMQLDLSPSTMNRICWAVEDVFDGNNFYNEEVAYDYTTLKCGVKYSLQEYSTIKGLCKKYKNDCMRAVKERRLKVAGYESDDDAEFDVNQLLLILEQSINENVSNEYIQCDILLDLCYRDGFNKQIVWTLCGDTIVDNLLRKHDNVMQYPSKCDDGDFVCCGNKFSMKTLVCGGENNEEF